MKELQDIDDLIRFCDKKIFNLNLGLTAENSEREEHKKDILMWRRKRSELVILQEKRFDEQVKQLTI